MLFDSTGIPPGELAANPFGVALRVRNKVFVSRAPVPHDVYPTAYAFLLEDDIPRQSANDNPIDSAVASASDGSASLDIGSWRVFN